VELERIDFRFVGKILAHQMRRRADCDQQSIDRGEVLHLLDGYTEQIVGVRGTESGDRAVGRLQRKRAVEVLQQQRVFDLRGLAQQPHHFQIGVGEIAHDSHRTCPHGRVSRGRLCRRGSAGYPACSRQPGGGRIAV
jgi:hypothetical protein